MKILVTGANGQLGREIAIQGHAHELILTDYDSLDITNVKVTQSFFLSLIHISEPTRPY